MGEEAEYSATTAIVSILGLHFCFKIEADDVATSVNILCVKDLVKLH